MPRSRTHDAGSADPGIVMFELFTEIGIIAQLGRTLLESRLDDGLTDHHFSALSHLIKRGDGKTPKDMAQAFQVPKTSMSHTLAGLEKRGLVRMEPNPADGRGKLVHITGAGRLLRERAIRDLAPDIAAIAPEFGPKEAEALLPGLRKLRETLDRARDN